jgi:predicted dehydrogenase
LAGQAFHAPLIDAVPGLELIAVVTRDEERRAALARAHPSARALDSADEIWERPGDFDLVVVATPNRTHVPLASAAIGAGLPVVVDKPLAATAAQAQGLIDEADDAHVMLTVFQNRRWDGDFLTAQRLIAAGELGRVMRFESRFERWRPDIEGEMFGSGGLAPADRSATTPEPPFRRRGWRESGDPDEAGGVLFDLGAHLVDQALQLFGPIESIYAELDARRAGAEVDDDAFVALEHSSGVRSHLWMSAVAANLGPRMRILGDRAAYVKRGLDVQEAALKAGGRPDEPGWGEEPERDWGVVGAGEEWTPVRTEAGAYVRFYEGVERALRTGAPPPVDPDDVVATLEVIDAARSVSPRTTSGARPEPPV